MGDNQEERVNIIRQESEVILLDQWINAAFRCDGKNQASCLLPRNVFNLQNAPWKYNNCPTVQHHSSMSWGLIGQFSQYQWLNSFLASCRGFCILSLFFSLFWKQLPVFIFIAKYVTSQQAVVTDNSRISRKGSENVDEKEMNGYRREGKRVRGKWVYRRERWGRKGLADNSS